MICNSKINCSKILNQSIWGTKGGEKNAFYFSLVTHIPQIETSKRLHLTLSDSFTRGWRKDFQNLILEHNHPCNWKLDVHESSECNFLASASCSITLNNLLISKMNVAVASYRQINKVSHSWSFSKFVIIRCMNKPSDFVYVHILQVTKHIMNDKDHNYLHKCE